VVQGILFVPNLWSYEQDLLSMLGSVESERLDVQLNQLEVASGISELSANGRLLGATIFDIKAGRTYTFGKIPLVRPVQRHVGKTQMRSGELADIVWRSNTSLGDFVVAAHLDATGIKGELQSHALKLLAVAIGIGFVVSLVGLWGSINYFIKPLKNIISLLRQNRLGEKVSIESSSSIDGSGEFADLIEEYNCMINDQQEAVRQVKVKQQFLEYAAHHDPLTHLPNRLMFDEKLKEGILESLEKDQPFAIYLVDVDNFKFFNDQYGYDVGDKMVKELSSRLMSMMRDVDTVARLDGDEFVVLQLDVADRGTTEDVAKRILKIMAKPFEYRGFVLKTTASVGISFFPDDVHIGQDSSQLSEEIVNNASVALQEAKNNGRASFQVFNEAMRKRITERMTLEEDLKTGLDEGQFEVYYQPKVNMQTGVVIGSEALVRWHHPTLGNIRPDIFIPVAEESGIIIPLGEWILQQACEDTLKLQSMGLGDLEIAVNISAVQFTGGDLLLMVRKLLDELRFSSELLELEITESAVMHDPEEVIRTLHDLKRLGVKLAIDDFGTGYSSLAYLKRFPVDTLKIDRAFIKDISRDSDDVVIVEAILGLGKHFDLKVVAEGVEDNDQLEFLRRQGCDIAQGYHLSPPLAFGQYVEWLEEWQAGQEAASSINTKSAQNKSVVQLHQKGR
jgi:diguanylate cyclase (GGDEF)-like protein